MRLRFGEFTLDRATQQLLKAGAERHLEPKAFELLDLLLGRRPDAVAKSEIRDRLWPTIFVSESSLTDLVALVRHALGDSPRQRRFVQTVHGFGYAFSAEAWDERATPPGRRHLIPRVIWDQRTIALGKLRLRHETATHFVCAGPTYRFLAEGGCPGRSISRGCRVISVSSTPGRRDTGRGQEQAPLCPRTLTTLCIEVTWRRGGDSNPRYRFKPVQQISNLPCSATPAPLRVRSGREAGRDRQQDRLARIVLAAFGDTGDPFRGERLSPTTLRGDAVSGRSATIEARSGA